MSTYAKRSWLRLLAHTLPGLGLAGALAAASLHTASLDAQEAPAPTKSYLNKSTITLPVLLEDKYRAQLKSIQLYVKESPSGPWKLQEQAPPTQKAFTYRASADGEYAFNIVSVDQAGRSLPADVTKEAPALLVIIDTQAPQVAVERAAPAPEGHVIKCEARDPNLDAAKSKLTYQTADQTWRDLPSQPGKAGTFCIPTQAAWTGMVRAVAVDLAGNNTTREMNLAATAAPSTPAAAAVGNVNAAPPAPGAKLPPAVATTNHETLVVVDPVTLRPQGQGQPIPPHPAPLPAALPDPTPVLPRTSGGPIPPLSAAPASAPAGSAPTGSAPAGSAPGKLSNSIVHRLPPVDPPALPPVSSALAPAASSVPSAPATPPSVLPAPGTPAKGVLPKLVAEPAPRPRPLAASVQEVKTTANREPLPPQRQLLNAKRTFVDYKVEALGASGVGKVEVWCSSDHGKTWVKVGEDTDRQSPVEVNLPGDGLYGVCLVVSNGRGFGGNPPRSGQTPDYWVEIDTSRPVADITAIHAADDGALHISWTARDKNLGQEPIELSYAARREGPWHTIGKALPNDGAYRWMPSADVGPQAFFRMAVKDEAGNVTQSETTQAVPLDDQSRPRGRVLGISTTASARPSTSPASRVTELPPPRTTDAQVLPQR